MHTSVIDVAAPAWPVPVQEPKYAKELRRVAIPVEANDASWSAIKGTWEVGTQVVMLNDAMKIAQELQSREDMLARRVAELERENASLHREKMRLQDEVDEVRKLSDEVVQQRDELLEDRDHVCALLGIDEREHGWIVEYPGVDDKLFGTFTDAMDAVSGDAIDCEHDRNALREQLATLRGLLKGSSVRIDMEKGRVRVLVNNAVIVPLQQHLIAIRDSDSELVPGSPP